MEPLIAAMVLFAIAVVVDYCFHDEIGALFFALLGTWALFITVFYGWLLLIGAVQHLVS